MGRKSRHLAGLLTLALTVLCFGNARAAEPRDFNAYMMRAYEVVKHRSAKYKLSSYFSKDLNYGDQLGVIKAKRPVGFTMCNAAVTEVIIEAINLYAVDPKNSGWSPKSIPPESWTRADWTLLMPHLFGHDYKEYDPLETISLKVIPRGLKKDITDFQSERGMAVALEKFGLGEQIPFEQARPGDIITFDREWKNGAPGHSAVFLAFLNDQQAEVIQYRKGKIVGFKYFSIQQSEPAGFGERWAYFKVQQNRKDSVGICPRLPADKISAGTKVSRCEDASPDNVGRNFPVLKRLQQARDCCIVQHGDEAPRVGRIYAPRYWRYAAKRKQLVSQERALRKHVEEFLGNIWRAEEQLHLFAKGALAFEKENPTAATEYMDKVKAKFGIDLRSVAQKSDTRRIDRKELNRVFKITPKRVIRLANQQVTTKTQTEIEQRVRSAAAKADLLISPKDDGVSNARFSGETD